MPLKHGYGVVVGALDHYQRDPINNFGQYYHENLFVRTPAGMYHCAIDVDTKMTNAFHAVVELAKQRNLGMRDAVYVIAVTRVAEACRDRGWV